MPIIKNQSVQVKEAGVKKNSGIKKETGLEEKGSVKKFSKLLKKIAVKNKNNKKQVKADGLESSLNKEELANKLNAKNKKALNIKFVRLENLVQESKEARKDLKSLKSSKALKTLSLNNEEKIKKPKGFILENEAALSNGENVEKNNDSLVLEKSLLKNEFTPEEDIVKNQKIEVKNNANTNSMLEITVVDLRKSIRNRISEKKDGSKLTEVNVNEKETENIKLTMFKSDFESFENLKDGKSLESKNFKNAFSGYMKDKGNTDIVKKTNFILKNDNKGEIKLILKPEKMGNVRIKINLNDNRIAGRIIVENNIVREVFENNMEMLNKAFKDSGFETAGINVFVGSDSGSESDFKDSEQDETAVFKIKNYDENSNSLDEEYKSDTLVNLVV